MSIHKTDIPKLELYSGKDQWKDWYGQFQSHRKLRGWSKRETADFLGMHLKGEPLHFYEQLSPEVQKDIERASKALKKRFGQSITPEVQRARFANLQQEDKESLQEFADRVRGLAVEAYPDLPASFIETEMINRFLMGCTAKEAGLFCLNLKHESLDTAIQAVQLYVERHRAMFGQKKVRKIEVAEQSEDSDSSKISRVQLNSTENREVLQLNHAKSRSESKETEQLRKRVDEIQSSLKKLHSMHIMAANRTQRAVMHQNTEFTSKERIKELERQIAALKNSKRTSSDQEQLTTLSAYNRQDSGQVPSRSPSPNRGRCFRCGQLGHMARSCPEIRSRSPSPVRRVAFDLNAKEEA